MAFSIGFIQDTSRVTVPVHKTLEAVGEIVLGDFREAFVASLSFWTKKQYEAHWREALNRMVRNVSPSCLITEIYEPGYGHFGFWWPMWRRGHEILVHHQGLLLMEGDEPFDPNNPYGFIQEYYRINEDGHKLSEWRVSVDEISTFLEQAGWTL